MPNVRQIKLTTGEPSALDRKSFPLTVGMPFAKGVLGPDEPVAIVDEAGQAHPLQMRVMETHADGSVRWLLVDYQSDLPSLGKVRHDLTIGKESPVAGTNQRVEIKEQDGLLIINNGVLKLEAAEQRCRPMLRVWRKGKLVSEGGLDSVVKAGDKSYFAANDSEVTLSFDERGPLRTVLRWDGKHKDKSGEGHLDFCVRMYIYAGQEFVRIDHIFTNRMDAKFSNVKSIVAQIPIKVGKELSYQLADNGGPGAYSSLLEVECPAELRQYDLGRLEFADAEGGLIKETKFSGIKAVSQGWVDVSGLSSGVLLAPKAFWQNYPKATVVGAEAVEYHLVPEQGKPFEIPRGMAKTHTFFLQFHAGRQEPRSRVDMAAALSRWPMPAASASYYAQTGEIWDIFPHKPKKYSQLDMALRELFYMDNTMKLSSSTDSPAICAGKAYGLKHYGDFLLYSPESWRSLDPEAKDAMYLNNEYDTAHVYAMLFLHNHEVMEWWEAEAHALHTMDVDTCHHITNNLDDYSIPDLRFMKYGQYPHCYQHVGNHQKLDETKDRPALGSHTFAQGVFDHYHLTGDSRARDIAVGTAITMGRMMQFYDWGMERNAGWGLLVMASGYAVEPHEDIHKGAEAMLDRLYEKLKLSEDGGEDILAGLAVSDRHVNLCMRGLIRWHQVTSDPRTEKLILALMCSYIEHGFMENGLPAAGTLPEAHYPTKPVQGFANLESLAYAYRLTGERKYIEAGIGILFRAIHWMHNPDEDNSSQFSHRMLRGPFPFMAIADELGILEKVPGAGGWLNP